MSRDKESDRSDAFAMDESSMIFLTDEEALALIVARKAEDVERRARRAKRIAEDEAARVQKAPHRRSRPVAETAKPSEKSVGGP